MSEAKYQAVIFDLLTGLLDSWSLWDEVAGSDRLGLAWRKSYLEITYTVGAYRPYGDIIREAAVAVDMPATAADRLMRRWGELKPWPEVGQVLGELAGRFQLATVTNSSNELADRAVPLVGVRFDVVVTAEQAGYYKPSPRPYLMALEALGCEPRRALYVAGSPADLPGARNAGMPVFWHNRRGLVPMGGDITGVDESQSLLPLLARLGLG